MQTTVERVDDTTVKLTVTVEAARVGAAIDAAARELAATVKVPGFRPGRVPRRVLETRLGKGALLEEAARDSLPGFYAEAVKAEDLVVVGPPEFSVDTFEDGKDAEFTATVEVRPEIAVPDYASLQVAHPEWEVTDDELAQQLDALRERFAELDSVSRPVQAGDHVVVSVSGKRHGRPVEQASGEDLLHEVAGEPETPLDKALLGTSPGGIVTFTDALGGDFGEELAGQDVDFTAIVKEVKHKRLPDLDDDFALTASEFDTIEELREDLRGQLGREKRAYARSALRGKLVEAVSDLVDVPLPQSLVTEELRFRVQRLGQQAQSYGMGVEDFLAAAGTTMEETLSTLEGEVRSTVKAQLVIDAIGRDARIQVDQADVGAEIARQAQRLGRPVEEVAELMLTPDRVTAVVADAFRRKTIDHLVASVQVLSAPPDEPEEPEAPEQPKAQPEAPEEPQEAGVPAAAAPTDTEAQR
ncbi:MAG: trigger factor [Euzebyaceae bacterium]|nr:trigger factor [Euzebyaceae bacterium]